jgi:four helix bundle protein
MFKDLTDMDVFIRAENLSNLIWDIVKQWSFFEKDTVGKQLVRAADSISANLAESHGRYHFKDKQNFIYYSRGSLEETRSWLRKSNQRKLINNQQNEQLCAIIDTIRPKFNRQIKNFGPSHKNN